MSSNPWLPFSSVYAKPAFFRTVFGDKFLFIKQRKETVSDASISIVAFKWSLRIARPQNDFLPLRDVYRLLFEDVNN